MSDFNAGDVVQLKSGGDRMTIEKVAGENAVCVWQDTKSKKHFRETYPFVVLRKFTTPRAIGVRF